MFDPSAPHIIILLAVVLLLFGSSRLPGAARSLGKSMHIFKNSVKGLDDDGQPGDDTFTHTQATVVPPAQQPAQQGQPAWPAPPQQLTVQPSDPAQQAQINELQRQIADLQRTSAGASGSGVPVTDSPPSSQSV